MKRKDGTCATANNELSHCFLGSDDLVASPPSGHLVLVAAPARVLGRPRVLGVIALGSTVVLLGGRLARKLCRSRARLKTSTAKRCASSTMTFTVWTMGGFSGICTCTSRQIMNGWSWWMGCD